MPPSPFTFLGEHVGEHVEAGTSFEKVYCKDDI